MLDAASIEAEIHFDGCGVLSVGCGGQTLNWI